MDLAGLLPPARAQTPFARASAPDLRAVEMRGRLVQRCSSGLLCIGPRDGAVASRDDGRAVFRLRRGFFCKNANEGTGSRDPLYLP